MPNTPLVTNGDGAGLVLSKHYTARDINATAASRAYAGFDLVPGDILCLDPYSSVTAQGGRAIGSCVALPTTGFAHLPHYVVVACHPDVNRGVDPSLAIDNTGAGSGAAVNPRAGGPVDVLVTGVCNCYVKGSAIAVGDAMAISMGTTTSGVKTRAVLAEAATTALTDASIDTLAELVPVLGALKAVALEADTSNVNVVKRVAWGGLAGNQSM